MGKSKRNITNWKQYNHALVNSGSATFWLDETAVNAWHCTQYYGGRGRGFQFSGTAIETALMLKGIFKLSLRATEGFINSQFQQMKIPLMAPDYSCISKRAKTVNIKYRNLSRGAVAHAVVDATGLKVYGEGEWKMRQHGKKHRILHKLHLVIDATTHDIIGAQVSLENVANNEVLPALLNPLRRRVRQVSADGAYDTKACHKLLRQKLAKPTIPPRSNARYWEPGHPRKEAVNALKAEKLKQWKLINHYHQCSLAETAMYRYKQLVSAKLSLRDYNGQVGGSIGCGVKALNKVIRLGMPIRQLIL